MPPHIRLKRIVRGIYVLDSLLDLRHISNLRKLLYLAENPGIEDRHLIVWVSRVAGLVVGCLMEPEAAAQIRPRVPMPILRVRHMGQLMNQGRRDIAPVLFYRSVSKYANRRRFPVRAGV